MNRSHPEGFSLIELMVVVAILSLAGAYLAPRFMRHEAGKKQAACHENLKRLAARETEFFSTRNAYTANLDALGWKPEGDRWHEYRFIPLSPPRAGFLFECSGNIDRDPAIDRATIDETGRIVQQDDDMTR